VAYFALDTTTPITLSVEEFNISTPSLVFLPVFIQARICIVDRAFFQGGKSEKIETRIASSIRRLRRPNFHRTWTPRTPTG